MRLNAFNSLAVLLVLSAGLVGCASPGRHVEQSEIIAALKARQYERAADLAELDAKYWSLTENPQILFRPALTARAKWFYLVSTASATEFKAEGRTARRKRAAAELERAVNTKLPRFDSADDYASVITDLGWSELLLAKYALDTEKNLKKARQWLDRLVSRSADPATGSLLYCLSALDAAEIYVATFDDVVAALEALRIGVSGQCGGEKVGDVYARAMNLTIKASLRQEQRRLEYENAIAYRARVSIKPCPEPGFTHCLMGRFYNAFEIAGLEGIARFYKYALTLPSAGGITNINWRIYDGAL